MSSKKSNKVHPLIAAHKVPSLPDLYASDIQQAANASGHDPWDIPWTVYLKHSEHKGTPIMMQFIQSHLWNTIRRTFFPIPKDEVAALELDNYRKGRDALKRQVVSGELLTRSFEKIARDIYKPEPIEYFKPNPHAKCERVLIINLSDWHVGANLDPDESGEAFGPLEEARAVACIVKNVLAYKMDHRAETRLIIVGIGDWIENFLHGSNQSSYVPIQIARAQELLRQMIIQFIGGGFLSIDFYGVSGNHDRDVMLHQKRAVKGRWASWATLIYLNLQAMFEHKDSNVKFHITKKPYAEFEAFGHRYYVGHGDNFLTAPNPGRKLDVNSIMVQALKLNNREVQAGRKPYQVFIVGHVHTPSIIHMETGCALVVNGPLIPPDMYAQSLGIHTAVRGHWLIEAVPNFPIGDHRLLKVNGSEYDKTLDDIIKVNKSLAALK